MKENEIKSIWCTLGPSSFNENVIIRLEEAGVSMFRINLSHTPEIQIMDTIINIQKYSSIPICIDTEGPQIRTGLIKKDKMVLKEGDVITINKDETISDENNLSLRPSEIVNKIMIGDLISVDFDSVLLHVIEKIDGGYLSKVISGGSVSSNKAVTLDRKITLPILSEKDIKGIKILNDLKLKNITLSFVNNYEDVKYVRSIINKDVKLISKIETTEALYNIDEIIDCSDGILIDRGDLSREEPINKIPLLQKKIIEITREKQKKVFVATNILESMVESKTPLRSEVNDIMSTLLDGASGLVLAAETAIGKYPVECANMVNRVIRYYEISKKGHSLDKLLKYDSFLLIQPHGGELVSRIDGDLNIKRIQELPRLFVDKFSIIDAEQIGIGTYSPLKGFMCKKDLNSVLKEFKLSDGQIWPMPIILQVKDEDYKRFSKNMDIALVYKGDKEIYATLHIEDKYKISLDKVTNEWFGTNSIEHPGVNRIKEKGPYCIGGKIKLIKRKPSDNKSIEFTPKQMRTIFNNKGWNKIAAFHTRNPIHRAHEFLQIESLNRKNLDGILLHPVIGPKKKGDFLTDVILDSYKIMFENNYYEKDKFVLAAFAGYSHYAGPREALFTALIRKNYGCNYFILGRDHTGVKNFYNTKQTIELFNQVGDIGIKPIFFDTVYYSDKYKSSIEDDCIKKIDKRYQISGTQLRSLFINSELPPEWFMRKEISEMISDKINQGHKVFID